VVADTKVETAVYLRVYHRSCPVPLRVGDGGRVGGQRRISNAFEPRETTE